MKMIVEGSSERNAKTICNREGCWREQPRLGACVYGKANKNVINNGRQNFAAVVIYYSLAFSCRDAGDVILS